MKSTISILFLFVFVIACKQAEVKNEGEETTELQKDTLRYTVTPFQPSKEYPDAALSRMDYKNGMFSTVITGKTYKLGEQTSDANQKSCANSAEGQHLHLIIDNEPYIAKYESSFTQDIPDGDHYLLTFLSRSYHESLKHPEASKSGLVTIKDKSIVANKPIEGPVLFYSRPKGLYTGSDTEKVMLDFYLVNTDLTGYKVEADINGEKHVLDKWQPYYVEGLPEGDNTITLTLVDSTGNKVNSPMNPVSRTFQLEKTPK